MKVVRTFLRADSVAESSVVSLRWFKQSFEYVYKAANISEGIVQRSRGGTDDGVAGVRDDAFEIELVLKFACISVEIKR